MCLTKILLTSGLVLSSAYSFAQVYSPPQLVLVGGESSPVGQLHPLVLRSLPHAPGLNGHSLLRVNGVTEYYHLSNLAPLTKIFSLSQIPLRSGETLGPLQPDFDGHTSSPGDLPSPSEFLFRVSSSFGESVAQFKNGAIRYIARSGTTLNGKVVAAADNIRPAASGNATFSVTMQGGGRRLYLYQRTTGSLTILTQSEKVLPGGRVVGPTPFFDAAVDDEAKRVFFRVQEPNVHNTVYSCKFDGTDMKFVADRTTLVPGSIRDISKLLHAQGGQVFLTAGDFIGNSALFTLQGQTIQSFFQTGLPLIPGQPNIVSASSPLCISQNGIWQASLVSYVPNGPSQLVARGVNSSAASSNIWLGPTVGTTYIDAATGRQFTLTGITTAVNISNSGDVQMIANVTMLDTGLTSAAILRAHLNIF